MTKEDRIRKHYRRLYRARHIYQHGWTGSHFGGMGESSAALVLELAQHYKMPCSQIRDICHRATDGQRVRYFLRLKIMANRRLSQEWQLINRRVTLSWHLRNQKSKETK